MEPGDISCKPQSSCDPYPSSPADMMHRQFGRSASVTRQASSNGARHSLSQTAPSFHGSKVSRPQQHSSICAADPSGNGSWRSNLFTRSSDTSPANSRSSSPLSSVLSSAEDLDLQLQQAAQFLLAFQEGSLGFGFSAGGLLFPVS